MYLCVCVCECVLDVIRAVCFESILWLQCGDWIEQRPGEPREGLWPSSCLDPVEAVEGARALRHGRTGLDWVGR